MPFAFPDDHRDLSVEFLISLLDDASLVVEPWVEASAIVQDRDAGFGQWRQVVDRRRRCHQTSHGGIPRIDTGNLVRIRDCPRVYLSRVRSGPFHHWLLRESVVDQGPVGLIPLLLHHAGLRRERWSND